jgi:hypothetical protein
VRAFPSGDWDGSCECEWYAGNDSNAFKRLATGGAEIALVLFDYNEARYECSAAAVAAGPLSMMSDVAMLELSLQGTGPIRRS